MSEEENKPSDFNLETLKTCFETCLGKDDLIYIDKYILGKYIWKRCVYLRSFSILCTPLLWFIAMSVHRRPFENCTRSHTLRFSMLHFDSSHFTVIQCDTMRDFFALTPLWNLHLLPYTLYIYFLTLIILTCTFENCAPSAPISTSPSFLLFGFIFLFNYILPVPPSYLMPSLSLPFLILISNNTP